MISLAGVGEKRPAAWKRDVDLGAPTEQALISLLALNGLRVSEATAPTLSS
jgi:hypothetical protein